MAIPSDVDVLIVGAGPTGLMLADQLARRGVGFVLIDRHAGPSVQTKALGVHARTLEIYDRLGIADVAVAEGRPARAVNLWANGRRSARLPFGDIGRGLSPFPFVLILGQDANERLLSGALRAHGGAVQWRTELVGLTQHDDAVQCALACADRSVRALRARWVAGCDGAHSAVRELNAIGFPGGPYQHVFFVADTTATGPMVAGELNVYLLRDGFHLFFPLPGDNHWRVVGILPPRLRDRDDLTFADVAPSIRAHVGAGLAFSDCRWLSTYRIHHRRAERFRDRRCFLLGDAAHIHSPVGAQGMNTGLQDAYNLAWKLALVIAGRAAEALLDTYQAERLPVARRLLETTDRAFSVVVSDGWTSRLLRTRVLARLAAFALRFQAVRRFVFRTVSQIGIGYRGTRLDGGAAGLSARGPRPGDRFPFLRLAFPDTAGVQDLFERLDDTRFNLLVIGEPVRAPALGPFDDLVRLHQIAASPANRRELARVGIPPRAFYLLRPDGHIGIAGRRIDAGAVARYLRTRVGLHRAAVR